MMELAIYKKHSSHYDEATNMLVNETIQCIRKMINPFLSQSRELLNIASGEKASEEIKNDLIKVEEVSIKFV